MAPLRSAIAFALALVAGSSLFSSGASAAPTATPASTSASTGTASAVKQLYSFSPPIYLENLRSRPNGRLVVGTFVHPWVYDFDPASPATAPRILATINDTKIDGLLGGVTGIAPISPGGDAYGVLGGNVNLTALTMQSAGLYVFDAAAATSEGGPPIVMRRAADLDGIILPNGLTPLPGFEGVFLLADSIGGAVYRADSRTGQVTLAVRDPEMAILGPPDGNSSLRVPLGVNGVSVLDGHLYWTNTARGSFNRLRIDPDGSRAPNATTEILAHVPASFPFYAGFDDFAITADGVAYIAVNPSGVVRVNTRSDPPAVSVVVQNNDALRDPTAVRFATGNQRVLYGTSNSGQIFEVDLP